MRSRPSTTHNFLAIIAVLCISQTTAYISAIHPSLQPEILQIFGSESGILNQISSNSPPLGGNNGIRERTDQNLISEEPSLEPIYKRAPAGRHSKLPELPRKKFIKEHDRILSEWNDAKKKHAEWQFSYPIKQKEFQARFEANINQREQEEREASAKGKTLAADRVKYFSRRNEEILRQYAKFEGWHSGIGRTRSELRKDLVNLLARAPSNDPPPVNPTLMKELITDRTPRYIPPVE